MIYTLIALGVIAVLVFIVIQNKKKRIEKFLCVQGSKRNGRVVNKPGQFYPTLSFLYRGEEVKVDTYPGSMASRSNVEIQMDVLTYRKCKIGFFENKILATSCLENLPRVKMGVPEFDRKVVVKSDEEFFTLKLISTPIQQRLNKIKIFPIECDFAKDKITVSINAKPKSDSDYGSVIDLTLALRERLKEVDHFSDPV